VKEDRSGLTPVVQLDLYFSALTFTSSNLHVCFICVCRGREGQAHWNIARRVVRESLLGSAGVAFCLKKVTLAASIVIFCCAMLLESDGSKYPRPWRV